MFFRVHLISSFCLLNCTSSRLLSTGGRVGTSPCPTRPSVIFSGRRLFPNYSFLRHILKPKSYISWRNILSTYTYIYILVLDVECRVYQYYDLHQDFETIKIKMVAALYKLLASVVLVLLVITFQLPEYQYEGKVNLINKLPARAPPSVYDWGNLNGWWHKCLW